MTSNYSIDEILSAIDDLQKFKKDKRDKSQKITDTNYKNLDIPKNTLKLIEEAEKSKGEINPDI